MCAHKSGDVPCGTIENLNRWFGIAGHLAAWAAIERISSLAEQFSAVQEEAETDTDVVESARV